MMKFFLSVCLFCIPYFLLGQTTQTKDDAGQMGGTPGFYQTFNPVNFPAGANGWWHWLDVRHSNMNNNYSMQFAGSFFDQNLWFRKTNNVADTEWSRVLTETNGNLNGKLNMVTADGLNFFTGRQLGAGYSFPGGIFKAISDNPNGQSNIFYEGVTAGVTNFTVRADGQGYFASGLGIGTQNPASKLHIAGDEFITLGNYEASNGVKGIHFTGFRDVRPNYFGASIEAVPEWVCCNGYPEGGIAGIKNIGLNFNVHFDGNVSDSKMTALAIRSTGYVGVGTTSPSAKFTVANGDIKAYNYDNNSGISIGAEASQQPRIGFHVSDNSRRFKIELNDINSVYERLGFFSTNSGQGAEQEIFTINKGGNVGVGENVPRSILHIKSNGAGIDGGNNFQYNGNGLIVEAKTGGRSTTSGAQIEFMIPANTTGDNQWGQGRIITVAGNSNNTDATGKMILGTRRMFNKKNIGQQWYYGDDIVIDGSGNIGMGTLNPKEKLSVFGTIRAMEVKVESGNWPDYVFEEGYSIGTLKELEGYIKANKHLPEMPSAVEIEKNGIAVGELIKKQQKTIEELTLHLIEKDKELSQEKELNKAQNDRLKNIEASQAKLEALLKKLLENN